VLGVPYISLDRLFWQPNWKKSSTEEFQAKIRAALDQCEEGWVVDGEYLKRAGPIVTSESTDIIWLDPPLLLYLPRIIKRTFLRLFNLQPPCSPGCPEKVREVFFSRESIVWWCLSNHWLNRRRNWEKMRALGLKAGSVDEGRKMRRIGGWGAELKKWLEDVKHMVSSKE